jgi:small GTP-binding protein
LTTNVLEGTLAALREAEVRLLTDIADTLADMGEIAHEDRKRLMDVARDLSELFFLVVVIGEFNAGKSTFINALLGDDLLPTGITPTTEVIEVIQYSETPNRKPTLREDGLRRWGHPNTGAPGVAIVDTPGTGSVFQKHERIAKDFLHRSDLVIFVISAKRAFAETERLYLEMAKNYGKKVLLVVNQIDLLQPNEQVQVRRFIEQQVKQLLDLQPLIFMVSARRALSAKGDPASDAGGIDAVRAHLRGLFNEAPPAQQKLLAQLDTAAGILKRYREAVQNRLDLVNTDTTKVREIQSELQEQSLGLDAQLRAARADVDKVFDGLRQRGMNFIDTNLSIRKVGRSVNREKLQAEFQEVVIGRALRDVQEASSGYINAVIDHSRMYWRGIIDRLNQLRDLLEQELSGLDAGVYAEQRESLEEAIALAESELKTYSSGRVVDDIQQSFQANMSNFRLSAITGTLGLIVFLAELVTKSALLAGPLAPIVPIVAIGATGVGGALAYRYYRRISDDTKREFVGRVEQFQKTYHDALDDLTRKERNRLAQYGNQVLTPIFSRLEVLAKRYAQQQAALNAQQDRLVTLRKGIEERR